MNMHRLFVLLIVLGIAITGCAADSGGDRAGQQARQDTQAAADEHAPASVVPGSYEDWCGEHGVPESACTRCDPSLIPAFKGGWCLVRPIPYCPLGFFYGDGYLCRHPEIERIIARTRANKSSGPH